MARMQRGNIVTDGLVGVIAVATIAVAAIATE